MSRPICTLIVDDSAFVRRALTKRGVINAGLVAPLPEIIPMLLEFIG
jgi:hypothetical protein